MGWRDFIRKARSFARRLTGGGPQTPVPPPSLPEGRVVAVPGRGEMFVRVARKGDQHPGRPSVVLLHGWALTADVNWFTGTYERASRLATVVAPDIRGHGRGLRSEYRFTLEDAADDVLGLIETMGVGPSILVGYSMGGSLALLCADRRPDLVAGLVLASTGLRWRSGLRERVLWSGIALVEYVLRFGAPRGLTERYLRGAVAQSPALKPYQGWVKAEMRRGDPADIGNAGKALAVFDARQLAARLRVPTVVVVTVEDRLIRASRQRTLAKAIANARVIEVEGAHNAWLVHPDRFAGALEQAISMIIEQPASAYSPVAMGAVRS